MSNFYSVKKGDKLKFKGCTCGYGLYLGDVVECTGVALDKFYWINPHTGDKRITKMGSSCFELVKEEVVKEVAREMVKEVAKEQPATKATKTTSRKKKSE